MEENLMPDSVPVKIKKLAFVGFSTALFVSLLILSVRGAGLAALVIIYPLFGALIASGIATALLINDHIFIKILYALLAVGLSFLLITPLSWLLDRLFG